SRCSIDVTLLIPHLLRPRLHAPLCLSCPFLLNAKRSPNTYPLSLHDALPILAATRAAMASVMAEESTAPSASSAPSAVLAGEAEDRKSTRLNSSHVSISYAVFCLKKKTRADLALTREISRLMRRSAVAVNFRT